MATTATKVRLNRKRCQSGFDCINFEYKIGLDGIKDLAFEKTKSNTAKKPKSIVEIKGNGGMISGRVNPTHFIHADNRKPLGIVESIKLEMIRNDVLEYLKTSLQEQLKEKYSDERICKLRITRIEINITLPCVGKATPSDMTHLFDMVYDETTVYRKRKKGSKCEKENTGAGGYGRDHYYVLKLYDKSADFERQEIPLENNIFRLEIAFIDKTLNALFGEHGRTIENVLSEESLDILCREYKRVLEEEIIKQHVEPYLNNCVTTLHESLTWSDSGKEISDTVMRYKEIIVDLECLRRALHKWYSDRIENPSDPTTKDHTDEIIYKYRKKELGLPEDVLKTLKAFHTAAG